MSPDVSYWTASASAVTVIAAIIGWFKTVRPRLRRTRGEIVAVRDSILGRDEIRDSITGELRVPALPGIGVRMATVEDALVRIADSHERLESLARSREDHEDRITKLEEAAVERVVTRAESAQAYRAIEAAINATPDDDH